MNPTSDGALDRRSYLPFLFEWPATWLARCLYRVRVFGQEHVPAEGGALVIANHLSYVDALVLHLAIPRRVRFVADRWLCRFWILRWIFELSGTIIADPAQPRRWMKDVTEALQRGEMVCLFPEAAISRTGQLMRLRTTFIKLAQDANVPVLPVAHDGLWGSVFSFSGNRLLFKSPRLTPTAVQVCIGAPIPGATATVVAVRQAMLDLGADAFAARPVLQRHLAHEVVRALSKRPLQRRIVDRTAQRREVKSFELLVAAITLAGRIRTEVAEARVGIVLPPGAGGVIANLAALLAGKVPVNFNFTAGEAAIRASFQAAGVRTVITAPAVRERLADFPWPAAWIDLAQVLQATPPLQRLATAALVLLVPNQWLPRLLGVPTYGGDAEAGLLFTSGSSGEPKGVPLSHRNVLANCWQISSLTILPESRSILACLPVFHSFGFTVTLWYPLLRGCEVVTVPSALDTKKLLEVIQEEEVAVLVSAPTFLRPILRRARPAELKSLSLVVCGAERLPGDVETGFRERFHISLMQGYGMTETSPVASVNQGAPPPDHSWSPIQIARKAESVGRLLPGITARILDPDTSQPLPLTARGLLVLRGANVFRGYLGDPERTSRVLNDGWYQTGDIGRFDDDGFLHVEGRLSRFSKIGGEMVPHGTVEEWMKGRFQPADSDEVALVVVGVADAAKGEALVVVTTLAIELESVRSGMLADGFAALWVPRRVLRVGKIPCLGTGKVDLRACAALAQATAET